MVLTGDALLVGDAGRPDLHAGASDSAEDMARALYRSLAERLLTLPDDLLLYPAHYSGSVCGRGLSATPASTLSTSPVPRITSSVAISTRSAPSFANSKPVLEIRSRPAITRVGLANW